MSFKFEIARNASALIFSIRGKILSSEDTEDILNQLDLELKNQNKQFLFDVSNLEYITSTGLNFFIRSLTRIRNSGGELVLCNMNGVVEKLFSISKLNEIFIICPTIEEGLIKINAQQA